ncbi:predicted protein [Lichtheimia corymbifera JMRC:FSU:9682]|uniref:Uncharacterized protein n=1 Tax=Lichtheimia corymbifera JMRC:FSU:9682 TaxID=1263082 RepID=A0A068RYV9_9FUNG|nr:predicted protein [Lichtheimia corymbifera JMRC:FSU:9682]
MEGNISWSELLKKTNVTAEHANDGNRIAATTESLKQAVAQLIMVLNERAQLLANSAQFDKALRDAAAIRAILPGSGLGYLTTGDVHCQQGRYAAAISIYDQSLETVPESDAYYQRLQQHRIAAATNNNKRIDFISGLPLDIVITNILPRIEPDCTSFTSFEPLDVSHAWRERILKHPKGLHFGFYGDTFNKDQTQIVKFAPYVQSVVVTFMTKFHLDDLFSRAHFANLKDLEINGIEDTLRRPLMKGLQMVSDSLTRLTIAQCPHIQLRDLLESCPNLVSLVAFDVELVMPSLPSSRFPKLWHLSLYDIQETALTYDFMDDVLSRFPSLLSLEITPMPESSVLTLLHQHCPYLQELYFGCHSDDIHEFDVHPNRKGVMSAHLAFDGMHYYVQDDLIQFLHQHRHSLETIGFGCFNIDDNHCRWRLVDGHLVQAHDNGDVPHLLPENDPTQTKTVFTRLVDVDFSNSNPPSAHGFMTWLISNAPNLKAIRLPESHFLSDVSNAMIKMSSLSKLEITKITGSAEFFNAIISFMRHHIATEDSSTLEEMTLHMDKEDMHEVIWLVLISRMKRLKDLKLLAGNISEHALPVLADIGHNCPSLESLTLGTDDSHFTDGIINALYQHPKLKYLAVGTHSLSAVDFLALSSFTSLERLHLHNYIPHLTKDKLRKHLPKLIIE